MTTTFNRAELASAFADCALVADKRCTIPVLQNARIMANANTAFITATDLDCELSCVLPVTGETTGESYTVPVHGVASFIKAAPDCETVPIVPPVFKECEGTDKNKTKYWSCVDPAKATFGTLEYTTEAICVEDWPDTFSRKAGTHSFEMSGADLWEAFDSVFFATCFEETRYYLNGVFMEQKADALNFVTSDGHRLARKTMVPPEGTTDIWPGCKEACAIIPNKAVKVLHRLWKGKACPDTVIVTVDEYSVRFVWNGNRIFRTKLIDGTFPDYRRVIPTSNDKILHVDSANLLGAIAAVSKVSTERSRAIKLELESAGMKVSANNPDGAGASMPVDCEFGSKDAMDIGFNAAYLESAIKAVAPGKAGTPIRMEFNDSGSPTRITGEREGLEVVCMPMRV